MLSLKRVVVVLVSLHSNRTTTKTEISTRCHILTKDNFLKHHRVPKWLKHLDSNNFVHGQSSGRKRKARPGLYTSSVMRSWASTEAPQRPTNGLYYQWKPHLRKVKTQVALLLTLLISVDIIISFNTFYHATNCQNIYPDNSILIYTQKPLGKEGFHLYTQYHPVQRPLVILLSLYKPLEMLTDILKYLDKKRISKPR